MKAVVAAFNQEKALVEAFSVITNLQMELFEALLSSIIAPSIQHPWLMAPVSFRGGHFRWQIQQIVVPQID